MDWALTGKDKRKLLCIRNISGIPTVVFRKKIRGNTKHIKFKNKTFIFDMSKPAFRSKNTFYYLCDADTGQIHFEKNIKSPIAPELLDSIINKHIVRDLVAGLENPAIWGYLIYVILGAGLGLAVGYIAGIKLG